MPGKLNLKINKGETFRHLLKWQDANETPVDLTGYSARMHIRSDIDATSTLIELTTVNQKITFPNEEDGEILIKLTAAETAAITWDSAVYDLELVSMDGLEEVVTRLVEGKVSVTKEVTR
jgi:hypothetical protein